MRLLTSNYLPNGTIAVIKKSLNMS